MSIGGFLEVGHNEKGEVVVNLDRDRTGHLIFSPEQARGLANLMRRRADYIDGSASLDEAEKLALVSKLAGEMATRLKAIRDKLETIVCTKDPDEGVVLLSSDGPCHYDAEMKAQVYDHQYFSPLGDALIEVWMMTDPEYEGPPCDGHEGNTTDGESSASALNSSSP